MRGLTRALTIFTGKKPFNDRLADDMQCGDMNERTLKQCYHLEQISTHINWSTYKAPYDHPLTRNIPAASKEKVVSMLFDELRSSSRYFSFIGAYQGVIAKLFNHMQYNNGVAYYDVQMDQAYKKLILSDKSENSTLVRIKNVLDTFDFNSYELNKEAFSLQLSQSRLPKYVRWKDSVNGLGVTVHDINSTEISIESLVFQGNSYTAVVKYKAQDHFGLDKDDIGKLKFNSISFFRIWFVLQRYEKFAYKPFFTNFGAKITLTGENNVS
ncbi:Protein of uncharacterised function (DUF3289) [Serratia quinivorans]|uniref:DUF3289 family protein n=1 Tax=Serratia quinivorans TaxID=137545 RepID=UPI002177F2B2|nr:DUF3289 family protein [Serratia quinivorans]CAI1645616.1 Protein of uncharacterised function (DUF3289) [Serratia quinivorans]